MSQVLESAFSLFLTLCRPSCIQAYSALESCVFEQILAGFILRILNSRPNSQKQCLVTFKGNNYICGGRKCFFETCSRSQPIPHSRLSAVHGRGWCFPGTRCHRHSKTKHNLKLGCGCVAWDVGYGGPLFEWCYAPKALCIHRALGHLGAMLETTLGTQCVMS